MCWTHDHELNFTTSGKKTETCEATGVMQIMQRHEITSLTLWRTYVRVYVLQLRKLDLENICRKMPNMCRVLCCSRILRILRLLQTVHFLVQHLPFVSWYRVFHSLLFVTPFLARVFFQFLNHDQGEWYETHGEFLPANSTGKVTAALAMHRSYDVTVPVHQRGTWTVSGSWRLGHAIDGFIP